MVIINDVTIIKQQINTNEKASQFKTVCNGDTAYITQLKQQKSQSCYYLGAR